MLPDKITQLDVSIAGRHGAGQLLKTSNFEFRYLDANPRQPEVALLMPASKQVTWGSGDLFAPMDQNLPEGDLYMRIRALFPKQQTTAMHMLALIGENGIGRLGYRLPGAEQTPGAEPITKDKLLNTTYTPEVFDELVRAYLSTGAGIETSVFDLSHDGQLLVLERFDTVIAEDGTVERLGFEDVASLAGLRVRDTLSDRKYHGSYQGVVNLLKTLQMDQKALTLFFVQVAFSVMVRNGDAHLKNFGVLYRSWSDKWLAPMFDVVTTSIYRYAQYAGGPELEDRTLALKLFAGKGQTKAYPTTEELLAFGERICGVRAPASYLKHIADGMRHALAEAETDSRIDGGLLARMREAWEPGLAYVTWRPRET